MTDNQTSPPPARKIKYPSVQVVMWGIAIVLTGLLIWFFSGKMVQVSKPVKSKEAPPVTALSGQSVPGGLEVAPPPPAMSISTLQDQLEQVLIGIREANQKKDLAKMLSYYSPNFPRLTNRAQSISKTWKIYNYPNMEFDIQEVKPINDNKAVARVNWKVESQNISTKKSKIVSKTYMIKFVKESGNWRIEALDDAP
jgi:hypothetical protein